MQGNRLPLLQVMHPAHNEFVSREGARDFLGRFLRSKKTAYLSDASAREALGAREVPVGLDPQSKTIVDAIHASGVLPLAQYTPVSAREALLKLRAAPLAIPVFPMWRVTEEPVTGPDGAFKVRILEPRAPQAGQLMPAVIYFHGGGFFAGGVDETDGIVGQIAKEADVVVFNVDYRLSPEARFPAAVNDAYAALEWVVANAARFKVNSQRIILSGDSAGGNLTIVTCLMARERGGPKIHYQVPIYPSLDCHSRPQYPSRLKWGAGGHFLTNDDIEWMLKYYLSSPDQADDWRASPIVAKSYAGLPPALVVTASHDPLSDEGRLYADRLAKDGVDTEYAPFEGTFHGFVSFVGLIEVAKRAMALVCERIKQRGWE